MAGKWIKGNIEAEATTGCLLMPCIEICNH